MPITVTPSRPIAQREPTPPPVGHTHLVGIGGVGMKALAKVLDEAGWEISGSDISCSLSLPTHWQAKRGHHVGHLLPPADIVVHSPAVESGNVELAAARRFGIPVVSLPQMLGRLMADRTGIAVAGTHGKSSTAAMTASILHAAGLDPTVIVGADCSRYGNGPHVLVEACEYRSSFLHLRPKVAAILNIEPDHFDYFKSAEHLEHEFARFVDLLPADGVLIARADCKATHRVVRGCAARVVSFGLGNGSQWQANLVAADRGRHRFELRVHGRLKCVVHLQAPGLHNVLNALAAAALAGQLGVEWAEIRQGLENFSGLRRRLETIGTAGDLTVIDDYAHHPTEITAALAAVRAMHPGKRICCVFEPHQASRTKSLLDELAASLQNADTLAVADIYRAREPAWQPGEITATDLAARARQWGACVASVHNMNEIEDWLVESWQRGSLPKDSVIVTLGAGHIGSVAHGVYNRIRKAGAA